MQETYQDLEPAYKRMKKFNIIYQKKGTNKTYSIVVTADDEITAKSKLTIAIIDGKIDEIKEVKDLHIITCNKV